MASLNQLRRDHANMARLLHILLLRHGTLEQGERPDFHLIREVVDYILEYMDGFIMPLERLYTEHLLAKEPEAEALSHQLAEDYQALRKRLNLLSETLDMILMDSVVPMERFVDDLKAYLDAHLAYLQAERDQLFPFLRKYLTDEQQKALLKMLPDGAQANIARLREDYPELYAEFKAAPSPFS
ncbi:MAG: hemerythrin domain-containing protein [Marinobacter sp.]